MNNLTSHQFLLDKLLEINRQDPALFLKVDNVKRFNLTSKVKNENDALKILKQSNFEVNLNDNDLQKLIVQAKTTTNGAELVQIYKQHHERIPISLIQKLEQPSLTEDEFKTERQKMMIKLNTKFQKRFKFWKLFLKECESSWLDKGIYLLHAGTFFVALRTDSNKTVYAPMFLKKVQLIVQDQKISLKNIDEKWYFNEKLKFILERCSDLTLPSELITETDNLELKLKIFNNWTKGNITLTDLYQSFKNLKREEIKWTEVRFNPGLIFGLVNPTGGQLRKIMQEIIDHEEISEILDSDPTDQEYKNQVNQFIQKNKQMVEITHLNFQQKKAIISGLKQNTIIWGPPGTGKSQVIANLIANIVEAGYKALVVSRKKTALDVLWNRLGGLKIFAFFISPTNRYKKKFSKINFYRPLAEFVNLVQTVDLNQTHGVNFKNNILEPKEHEAIKSYLQATSNKESYDASLKVLQLLGGWYDECKNYLPFIKSDYKYPFNKNLTWKQYLKKTVKINEVRRKMLFGYPRHFLNSAKYAFSFSYEFPKLELNSIVENFKKTNVQTINTLLYKSKLLHPQKSHSDLKANMDGLVNQIGISIRSKIQAWRKNQKYDIDQKYKRYKSFAAAVRAGRLLPETFLSKHHLMIEHLFSIFVTTPEIMMKGWQRKHYFDYLIVDEASQMPTATGLALMYLAKTKIIAGDTEQLQPSNWFQISSDDNGEAAAMEEGTESLLRYSKEQRVYEVMLQQNYRSESAALMSFSSKHFYHSKLKVIDRLGKKICHPIEVKHCSNGRWDDGQNEVEAYKVLNLCLHNLNIPDYKSIIILTFNYKQRRLVEEIIIDDPRYWKIQKWWDAGKIMVKNIENIQGDEADLVIISVVYDATTQTAGTYIARPGGKNALNVSISRAKKKMIVCKSVTAKTIRPCRSDDFQIFKAWLEFLDLTEPQQKVYCSSDNSKRIRKSYGDIESSFEAEVKHYLKQKIKIAAKAPDLDLICQYEVGSLRIDLAFVISDNQHFVLGIEVDGFPYHGLNRLHEDNERQTFLEEKGYQIYRIKDVYWSYDKRAVIREINAVLKHKLSIMSN